MPADGPWLPLYAMSTSCQILGDVSILLNHCFFNCRMRKIIIVLVTTLLINVHELPAFPSFLYS